MMTSGLLFMSMEPAGLTENKHLLYQPVYYGTPGSLFEFFSRGTDEQEQKKIQSLILLPPSGDLGIVTFRDQKGSDKAFMFRVYSEGMLENIYIGVRNIVKGEHSAW